MKISKKLLAAFSVAAMLVTALSVTGCKKEDDEENAISGEVLEYDNSTGNDTYRAYSSTRLKHLGALTRIEIKNQNVPLDSSNTQAANGVIGLIWDMKSSSKAKDAAGYDETKDTVSVTDGKASEAINFLIAGFRYNRTSKKVEYYVSKFYNITEVNKVNFGAATVAANGTVTYDQTVTLDTTGLEATTPKEHVLKAGNNTTFAAIGNAIEPNTSGSIFVWADIYPANTKSLGTYYGLKGESNENKTAGDGAWIVEVYVSNDANFVPTATSTYTDRYVIPAGDSGTGYTTTPKQAKVARYLNAYQKSKMSGVLTYSKTYAQDEVVEE